MKICEVGTIRIDVVVLSNLVIDGKHLSSRGRLYPDDAQIKRAPAQEDKAVLKSRTTFSEYFDFMLHL